MIDYESILSENVNISWKLQSFFLLKNRVDSFQKSFFDLILLLRSQMLHSCYNKMPVISELFNL